MLCQKNVLQLMQIQMCSPDSKQNFENPNASHKLTTTTQKPQFEKDALKYVNGTSQEENDMI